MSDIGTALTVLGAAIGTKDLIVKVLGPTADYLGEGLKGWAQRRTENLGRTFAAAARKLPAHLPEGTGVSPRVLSVILNAASFVEDQVTTEYFAGVLASSRSGSERDDRGTSIAALVARLSSYQIRAHYVIYSCVRQVFLGSEHSVTLPEGRRELLLFIPFSDFAAAMALEKEEALGDIGGHICFGLAREELIDGQFSFGTQDHVKKLAPTAEADGLVIAPSALGVELFLWANGLGNVNPAYFLDSGIVIETLPDVVIPQTSHPARPQGTDSQPSPAPDGQAADEGN